MAMSGVAISGRNVMSINAWSDMHCMLCDAELLLHRIHTDNIQHTVTTAVSLYSLKSLLIVGMSCDTSLMLVFLASCFVRQ